MERQASIKRVQEEALNPDRAEGASGGGSLLFFVVSIVIYYSNGAGKGGTAICATDLTGWHYVNALVSLGGCLSPMAFLILKKISGFCGSDLIRSILDMFSRLVAAGLSIFLVIWYIIGNMRLWDTTACDPDELGSNPNCCSAGLWQATFGWFVFTYVVLGLLVCCCCCCFCFAGLAASEGETDGGESKVEGEDGNLIEEGQKGKDQEGTDIEEDRGVVA